MKKVPFDLKYKYQIELHEVGVVTEGELPVEILKWDAGGNYPIVALTTLGDGSVEVNLYDYKGRRANASNLIDEYYNLSVVIPDMNETTLAYSAKAILDLVNKYAIEPVGFEYIKDDVRKIAHLFADESCGGECEDPALETQLKIWFNKGKTQGFEEAVKVIERETGVTLSLSELFDKLPKEY